MAYDLAAAIIISYLVEKDSAKIISKIHSLKLPARRFFEEKVKDDVVLVSDYAHHPTEINAIITSIRLKYPDYKLVVVYQGHTHSRTNTFLKDYVKSLKKSDEVYIMPTFSSVRETEASDYVLLNECDSFKKYEKDVIEKYLEEENIVIAFLGAGDIDNEFIFLLKKVNYWKPFLYML